MNVKEAVRTAKEAVQIEVQDFGPIAEAKVDLRPMTVFIGPSNTGKSYLAILIYALHRCFGGGVGPVNRRFRRPHSFSLGRRRTDLSDKSFDALLGTVRGLLEGSDGKIVLPPEVADVLRSEFDENAEDLVREISRCFGLDEPHALIRKGVRNTVCITMRRKNGSQFGEHTLRLGRKAEFRTTIPSGIPLPVDYGTDDGMERDVMRHRLSMLYEGKRDATRWAVREAISFIGDLVLPSAVGVLHWPTFYLPADRTGVMHAHSVVVRALIASASMAGLRHGAPTPLLSGVLADFLEQLIGIGHPRWARRKHDPDRGTRMEKALLEGSVQIIPSEVTGYPRFVYRPKGWKDNLELANASSMVSELAPVVLYLRYLIRPDNVLIVEEPEAHLHPAKQVEFVSQLATLVQEGIRVIITTHSEWLLEALANIVGRSESSQTNGKVALRPDQVGVWLFRPKSRPKGSIVKEIPLDDDSGLYLSGYEKVATELHNDWAALSSGGS